MESCRTGWLFSVFVMIVKVMTCMVVFTSTVNGSNYCDFPEFLWKPHQPRTGHGSGIGGTGGGGMGGGGGVGVAGLEAEVGGWVGSVTREETTVSTGDEKRWTTKTNYSMVDQTGGSSNGSVGGGSNIGGGGNWTSQHEIIVRRTQITVQNVTKAICLDSHTNVTTSCLRKVLIHRIFCVSAELDDKYRVLIKGGNSEFSCMKFIARGRNVVQVYSAPGSRINEDKVCEFSRLQRDAWPWISHKKEHWSFCPFVGGFDLKAGQTHGKGKRTCKHQWRPARMESECMLGEGVQVYFPDDRCTVLDGHLSDVTLYCVGSWTEEDRQFVILGRLDSEPQYTVLMPHDVNALKEFHVNLFYSPIAPSYSEPLPPGVASANIKMLRSDSGVCFDESETCSEFAREGKCINSALHKFANYCKKSCGLCGHKADLGPSVRSECLFPEEYRGRWLLYESDRVEEVVIEDGHISFQKIGNYICKSKHWKKDQFKMLSVYSDGCRPRYSCIHFRMDGVVLFFQISKSSLLDKSFDLCEFRDDPAPLHDKIRSRRMKLLLPQVRINFNSCGLGGLVPVNVTFVNDNVTCDGTLSDWDPIACEQTTSLSLITRHCNSLQQQKFQCVANVAINEGTSVLITNNPSSSLSSIFQCWVIHTHAERMSLRPWKLVHVFDRGQCGTANDLMHAAGGLSLSRDRSEATPLLTIYTYTDVTTASCPSGRGSVSSIPSRPMTNFITSSTRHARGRHHTPLTLTPSTVSKPYVLPLTSTAQRWSFYNTPLSRPPVTFTPPRSSSAINKFNRRTTSVVPREASDLQSSSRSMYGCFSEQFDVTVVLVVISALAFSLNFSGQ